MGRVDISHLVPTPRGLPAGSNNLSTLMDPANKPRDVGEETKCQQTIISYQF